MHNIKNDVQTQASSAESHRHQSKLKLKGDGDSLKVPASTPTEFHRDLALWFSLDLRPFCDVEAKGFEFFFQEFSFLQVTVSSKQYQVETKLLKVNIYDITLLHQSKSSTASSVGPPISEIFLPSFYFKKYIDKNLCNASPQWKSIQCVGKPE